MAQKDLKLTASGAYTGDGTESNNQRCQDNFDELYAVDGPLADAIAAAEAAQGLAEDARDASVVAQGLAEDARDAALAAELLHYVEVTVTFADVAAGAGAKTTDIFTAAADEIILDAGVEVTQLWANDGTLSACTASVGHDVGPDVDAYVTAIDVFTGAATGNRISPRGADLAAATHQPVLASTKKAQLTLTPTGDSLENATAGSVTAWVLYRAKA